MSRIASDRRTAQREWAAAGPNERAALIGRFRGVVAGRAREIADRVARRAAAETMASEILPLLAAARFLERSGARLLAPRRRGVRGAPLWLTGTAVEVVREPLGVVLIVGPANYPLMLPGVQALQALAAGNAVIVKPGRGGKAVLDAFADALREAGLPDGVLTVTDESVEAGTALLRAGVDQLVFTGSHAAGRDALALTAAALTPAVLELSGWDAAFVRDDADVRLTARALRFGATLNGGATCLAPRRVIVEAARAAALERALGEALDGATAVRLEPGPAGRARALIDDALARGARIVRGGFAASDGEDRFHPLVLAEVSPSMRISRTEVFAPLLLILAADGDDDALRIASACPYALGATVFGRDVAAARRLAARVDAGVVVVNDAVVPTADPRVPLAARGASGFGVTRGAEGLLAMTRPKAIVRSRGFKPHLTDAPLSSAALEAFIGLIYGSGLRARTAGTGALVRAWIARRRPAPAPAGYASARAPPSEEAPR